MADVLSKSGSMVGVTACVCHFPSCGSLEKGAVSSLAFAPFPKSGKGFESLKTSLGGAFFGKKVDSGSCEMGRSPPVNSGAQPLSVQMSLTVFKSMRWWEKGVQPNMKEINSAQDLVRSLSDAANKLVIVDFFSPGCGGCRALHPKICQFAENNPEVLFLQVNYEEHKSMCYSLNVHVLPFFRFYRGANGRLCSFSCTNATIKKFKDALAKHSTDRCSLGPARGLEESELLALAANKDLSFSYTRKPEQLSPDDLAETAVPAPPKSTKESDEKTVATAWR